MQKSPPIYNLYKPVQPSAGLVSDSRNVSYLEIRPDARLLQFIYCYWQLKTKIPLDTPYTYRVAADGCFDIFFETANPDENFIMSLKQASATGSFGACSTDI